MGTFIQKLLGSSHPHFATALQELERTIVNDSVDTRLIGDITHAAHDVIRRLNLDVAGSTAEEVYRALNVQSKQSDFRDFMFNKDFVLLMVDGELISFNLIDVIENSHHELAFEDRIFNHGRRALRGEIVQRYLKNDSTDNQTTKNIATDAGLILAEDELHARLEDMNAGSEENSDKPYILAIGDINTNAFIKMNEEHGEITTDDQGYTRLSIEMGGKIPYDEVEEFRAGECSPNAAVSMTRLGLKVDLMTWLGDDESGKLMVEYLQEQGVGTNYMMVEEGQKSNYHYVLRFGADRTKLQKFENYSYKWQEPATVPDWIYLGVLGEDTWHLHEAILDYMNRNESVKLIFQPGMYHLMWGAEKLAEFYKRAELVVINREEAAQITGRDRSDLHGLIQGMHDLGVSIAVVTDGSEGAYASNGSGTLFMPNYPDPAPPFERTGAGDAFASTLSAALALGEPLESALRWAPINSAYVVQQMGAQRGLLKFDELQKHLAEAPDWYHPKELE